MRAGYHSNHSDHEVFLAHAILTCSMNNFRISAEYILLQILFFNIQMRIFVLSIRICELFIENMHL